MPQVRSSCAKPSRCFPWCPWGLDWLAAGFSCDVEHWTGWAGGADKGPSAAWTGAILVGISKGLSSVELWLVRSMIRPAEINRWLVFLQISTVSFTWSNSVMCGGYVVAAMDLFSGKLLTSLYLVIIKTAPWNSLHFCWFWILYELKRSKIIHVPLLRLVFFLRPA